MAARWSTEGGAPKPGQRCWRWGRDACRNHATNTVRIGSSVYQFCDNPDHDPRKDRP